jgi:hypothetical protein
MKIMATWFREGRGVAIGILVGGLTAGSATPHPIRDLADLPRRAVLLAAAVLRERSARLAARGGGSHLGLNAPAATCVAMELAGARGAYLTGRPPTAGSAPPSSWRL